MRPLASALVTLSSLVAACSPTAGCACDIVQTTEAIPVGMMAASWSEQAYERQELDTLIPSGQESMVIQDDLTRREWLAGLAPDIDPGNLASIDLTSDFLVVGQYARCSNEGRVVAGAAGEQVWFEAVERYPNKTFDCAWSPQTVEVWRVGTDDVSPGFEFRTSEAGRLT